MHTAYPCLRAIPLFPGFKGHEQPKPSRFFFRVPQKTNMTRPKPISREILMQIQTLLFAPPSPRTRCWRSTPTACTGAGSRRVSERWKIRREPNRYPRKPKRKNPEGNKMKQKGSRCHMLQTGAVQLRLKNSQICDDGCKNSILVDNRGQYP